MRSKWLLPHGTKKLNQSLIILLNLNLIKRHLSTEFYLVSVIDSYVCLANVFSVFLCVQVQFFTARCYASAVLAMALCPSVRLSVCPSVTSRCSTKTAKRRITQTTPHDNSGTLQFPDAKDFREIRPGSPPPRAPNAGWVGQNRRLLTNNRLYLENGTNRHIVSIKVEQEVVCALSNGDITVDLECLLTTPNHPIFCISHRHSQLRNG